MSGAVVALSGWVFGADAVVGSSLGAVAVSRAEYHRLLDAALPLPDAFRRLA